MVSRFVDGINGNDGNDGLSPITGGGHGPKASLNGVEDTPVVAGDTIYVRPTVYRELWTWDVSGGNAYTAGTVNVTNGSAVVIGVGTLWLANVAADYMFHNTIFASGADGVTNGTATFTSAAGNFQAAMIGQIIQINTKGAYKIANVAAANSITLSDPNGLGWPAAGVGLTYSVMSGIEPFDVLSVDGNTQLTLTAPWHGPTLTGLAYTTYNPIRAIGDVAGQIWGVGGTVRITGSDNDQTATRANCIVFSGRSYRVARGFAFDLATGNLVDAASSPLYITIEDCNFSHVVLNSFGVGVAGTNQLAVTLQRCNFYNVGRGSGITFSNLGAISTRCHLISNCTFSTTFYGIACNRVGGVTIKNSEIVGAFSTGMVYTTAPPVGQTTIVLNSLVQSCVTGLSAAASGQITPNYCAFFGNTTNYVNTTAGANDNIYPALLAVPILHSGSRLPPPLLGELSQWSQVRGLAGFGEPPSDIFGIKRPATSAKNSWGAIQYHNQLRDTATVRTGTASLELSDAGRLQIIIPVEAINTTIACYAYREANYAGINPQMILKQPGQADIVVTDAGAAGAWNQLTHTWIPAVVPNYVIIELVSNNTALAGAYSVFFDDLTVNPLDTDTMEAWTADVQHINYAEELSTPPTAFSPVGGEIVGA